jgi:NIMA (never in mitosis gene a)-related kinase
MENFEIISKLGAGGFSKVYKVKRKIDNQIYALKKVHILNLSEKQKLSSLNEIRVLASINSKYVVNYKEAFLDEKDSTLCLVMEYADRGDLANRIKEQKKKGKYFNERDIWRVFIQLVKGLKALHDLKILHRDIKSSNIFLFSDGTAKLGDLNVCKILSNNVLGKTQAGTPSYAAPEVWMEKPYGLKSDIWSLGCVLYEIISLHCPFRGENVVELYNKILIGEFIRIPNRFSDELNWIIEHMINSDVNKRLSCDEILKCEYIKKRLGQNKSIKSNSNKKLNIIEKKFEERNETEKIDLIKFYNDLGNINDIFSQNTIFEFLFNYFNKHIDILQYLYENDFTKNSNNKLFYQILFDLYFEYGQEAKIIIKIINLLKKR